MSELPESQSRESKSAEDPEPKPPGFETRVNFRPWRDRQIPGLRVDPWNELAGIWTENNFPSEDIARILEIANEAFDDSARALRWLEEPNIQTGNRPPVSLIGTPEGFAAVESVLRQIQYGIFG